MTGALLLIVVAGLFVVGLYLATAPSNPRSGAEAQVQSYAARRSREAEELKRGLRGDALRARFEFDAAMRDLGE